MYFKEYEKECKIGEIVWICDFRFNNEFFKKPIRKVLPTKVIVCSNDDLPKRKTVYYSEVHFKKLNKNGEPLKSSVIGPYDNTGYRSYPGVSVNIFKSEMECRMFFKILCSGLVEEIKFERDNIFDRYNRLIEEIVNF
jgi:hypothetical protein